MRIRFVLLKLTPLAEGLYPTLGDQIPHLFKGRLHIRFVLLKLTLEHCEE